MVIASNPAPKLLVRQRRALSSAMLASGVEQVIDFALPVAAGSALGLTAVQTGILVAASLLVAFALRPLAGRIVDRHERTRLAALGAAGFGVACLGYAAATGLPLALAAAALAGASGSLVWVALRAIVGERLPQDSSVFARLMAAEETGGWLVLVPAIALLALAGHQWVFGAMAACCFAASVLLSTSPRRPRPSPPNAEAEERPSGALRPSRRLRPMLLAVVVTMTAESAIGLLLILHLQRGLGLGIIEIASVFLPGAIAMSVLPPHLHRAVAALGRRRVVMLGAIASAVFAVCLAFTSQPGAIAALWVLSAVAWAAVVPLQQAAVAEASGQAALGRGLGLYEAASLLGAAIGAAAAGWLYGASWPVACLACAGVIASGALLGPAALRRLGVQDRPPQAPTQDHPTSATPSPPHRTPRRVLRGLGGHAAVFLVVFLIALAAFPEIAAPNMLGIGPGSRSIHSTVVGLLEGQPDPAEVVAAALRVWVVILLIDAGWSVWLLRRSRPSVRR